ncbi:MAG: uroporphyrinogen decarboxylase family protein, partial [Kiritimatiellia bacterium]
SLMGWTRNWMGVEGSAYLMADDPDVYADIVDTLSDLACWGLDQILPRMSRPPDIACGWEDICGRSGPFVSPDMFQRCVAPGYRKIRQKLEAHGVHLFGVDCDGVIEPLVRGWLDSGVNVLFPMEIGVWNTDPYDLRKRFGHELRMIGGFNKMVIEQGPAAIDAEIARRLPLMKEGGFVMLTDHLVTPGASLANYKYYLDRVRALRF